MSRLTDRLRPWRPILATCFCVAVGLAVGPASAAGDERPSRWPAQREGWTTLKAAADGQERLEREARRRAEYQRRFARVHELLGARQVSAKSQRLLAERGLGPALCAGHSHAKAQREAGALRADGIDTLRVLLVRIAFETNRRPDLTTVAPDGEFMLEPVPSTPRPQIDPPPHDAAYFGAHLEGLREFYGYQSGGRLAIEFTVLPPDPQASYKLTDIADYGPGESGNFWNIDSLERLVRDMITAADAGSQADGSVDLSDYADDDPFTYIIFAHAGSDWQSDIAADSPNDIPTFFVALGEPEPLIGGGQLSECSVIPETTTQDDFQGSIAAALYHEFGHALGLVDIYSTWTGLPQVGVWDLMDSGTNLSVPIGYYPDPSDSSQIEVEIAVGVLPPSLGAWDKWFLGWAEVAELEGEEQLYRLPAVQVPREEYELYRPEYGDFQETYPQVIKAGASEREFFLIENRWVPISGNETPYTDIFFEADAQTGVIQYLGGTLPGGDRNTGYYDYFQPGGGVLVWHVNMDRIEAGLADNTINRYGDGLRLVEADGIQDIGVIDAYVQGFFGSALDPFGGYDWEGNPNDFDTLYDEGRPASRAYDRSWTGVTLTDVRNNTPGLNSVMRFEGAVAPIVRGFPFTVAPIDSTEAATVGGEAGPRALAPRSLTPIPGSAATPTVCFVDQASAQWTGTSYAPLLFALTYTGAPHYTAPVNLPFGAVHRFSAPLAGAPVQTTLPQGEGLVFGTADGAVSALIAEGTELFWPWQWSGADTLSFAPVAGTGPAGTPRLLCVADANAIYLLGNDGEPIGAPVDLGAAGEVGEFTGEPVAVPRQPATSYLLFATAGWFRIDQDAEGLLPTAPFVPYARALAESAVERALVPLTDAWLLLVFDAAGLVGSWRIEANGDTAAAPWDADPETALVAEPAVADLDGNGRHDVILLTAERILALQADGVPVTGFPVRPLDLFPLADSTRVAGIPIVCDADGDGVNELFCQTNRGHLLALSARGELLARTPYLWGGRGGLGAAIGPGESGSDERLLWLVDGAGNSGPPLDRQLYNGRVVAYRLPGSAATAAGTSEWLGPGGGPRRSGPVGEAIDLGPSSPLAAAAGAPIYYPNPLREDRVTVRFYSDSGRDAQLAVYNLEGEELVNTTIPVNAGQMNEHSLVLPHLASGLYICRLQRETAAGYQTEVTTLAVER